MADRQEWIVHQGRVTRRTVLKGAVGALGLSALIAACGDDEEDGGTAATTGGTTGGATGGTTGGTTGATTGGTTGGPAPAASELATLLGVEEQFAGTGQTIELGAVLALTGPGSFYGKTMSRGLDLAKKHIAAAGGPTFEYIYIDHKSGDAAAGQAAITELGTRGVPAKFASYADNLGSMLAGTAQYKVFTLDGGGGTSIFAQNQPYFWGTRAITPNDVLPGLFAYLKEAYPEAKTVGLTGWDVGEPSNGIVKEDVLKKIADAGFEHNGLYELVPVGGQDFSQVIPKIKANEPDILLLGLYGQDIGSFTNQAGTAGLKAIRVAFEFTPDGVNASKGTYEQGFTFAYDYFDPASAASPLGKLFVQEFRNEYGEDPDFYAANYYEDALVMWELVRRVLKKGEQVTGDTLDQALRDNLTVVSVYGGDESTVGTFTLDATTHSVVKREMGVFEYKDGNVTPKAFFGINAEGYRKV